MHFSLLALAFAALAIASPKPPKKEFAVGFTLGLAKDATLLVGYINTNDSAPYTNILIGNSLNETTGTPAYFNGTGNKLALIQDQRITRNPNLKGLFGAHITDFGNSYGKVDVVSFIYNYQDFNYSVKDKVISHKLTSPNQAFFACLRPFVGSEYWTLSFGVYNKDKTPPSGCKSTRVVQIFDIESSGDPSGD